MKEVARDTRLLYSSWSTATEKKIRIYIIIFFLKICYSRLKSVAWGAEFLNMQVQTRSFCLFFIFMFALSASFAEKRRCHRWSEHVQGISYI